jgi:hypothetical protein
VFTATTARLIAQYLSKLLRKKKAGTHGMQGSPKKRDEEVRAKEVNPEANDHTHCDK